MNFFSSSRRRWYVLAVSWIVLIVLGYGGFVEQARAAGGNPKFLDMLYETVQLALLEYGGGGDNWRLEVARFAAPLMATGTLAQAASVVFRDQFLRLRLRRSRGHVVVAGLGASGTRLALALAEKGRKVVGLDPDPASPGLEALRSHDIPCISGDPKDPDVLRSVRLDRATGLVSLCATDAVNVSVVVAAQQVERDKKHGALRASIHLEDSELTELLRGSGLSSAGLGAKGRVRVEFFNLHDQGARALLADHFDASPDPLPHLVVVGLGQLGRSLVVNAAQRAARSDYRLPITMIDIDATKRWKGLVMQHPALNEAVDAMLLDVDIEHPDEDALEILQAKIAEAGPDLVAVVLDDESMALTTGLLLHRLVHDPEVLVVIRTRGDAGLGGIVAGDRFPGLELFPMLDKACSPAIIEGGTREQVARSVHEDHRARTATGGQYDHPWDELTDEQRESSRLSADGMLDSMAEVGLGVVPLRHWGSVAMVLEDEEVQRLAVQEHERWRAERLAQGWTFGPERDDENKHNPQLVPYDELSDYWKDDCVARIAGIPDQLARAGFELVRKAPVARA